MGKVSSPSDFTNINVDYSAGNGHYTTHADISNLLQISSFSANTTPNLSEIGKLIKRAEEKIDDTIKSSYRPIIYRDEFHSLETQRRNAYPVVAYKDYVGFVQLSYPKIQKLVRLEVYQGDTWKDLASASASLIVPDSATTNDWTITLTVGNPTTYTFYIKNLANNSIRHFYDNFGPKTTASQIVDTINEVYPMKTAKFTGETTSKSITADGASSVHVSDFFYATTDSEDKTKIIISSLLDGEDGTYCTLSSTYGSVTSFADNQTSGRNDDFWMMKDDGKIFFRKEYPHNQHHSIKVTYVAGESRVPAPIHEAATKIVAAEIIRHDDNSILITETGSNIDLKSKHDILLEEANAILNGKKNIVHFIS
jgi:hypothetical protein|tara:strand:- start:830 stop:1930 length:1101 start_codon:yes stop_codon:yes gene_type:complete